MWELTSHLEIKEFLTYRNAENSKKEVSIDVEKVSGVHFQDDEENEKTMLRIID